jgi:CRISPR-associated endoribonuclease Cas6
MILKLKFKSKDSFEFKNAQEKLSSLIYKKLSYSDYSSIHKESLTNVSFSPLYPFLKDNMMLGNELYSLEIRSNDKMLIKALYDKLYIDGFFELDNNRCEITHIESSKLQNRIFKVKTLSPIVISINDTMAEAYEIEKKSKTLYWTPNMNFELFIDMLNQNMVRKFNKYSDKKYDESFKSIISYKLLKNFPIKVAYKKGFIYGSLWEFSFVESAKDLVEFNYLCGFGEKSGIGFGFVK